MSIGSMIESTAGICGERPRLAGTRVPVHRVAGYYRLGYAPEEILGLLNSLTLSKVHAGIAYALANPEEMTEYLLPPPGSQCRPGSPHKTASGVVRGVVI